MRPYRSLRVLMCCYASMSILMGPLGPYRSLIVLMDSNEFLLVLIVFRSSLCVVYTYLRTH